VSVSALFVAQLGAGWVVDLVKHQHCLQLGGATLASLLLSVLS
jgi:hypothetical protein